VNEGKVRAFVALPLDAPLHAALDRLQGRLRRRIPYGVRWVRTEGIHLTLFFLGEIPAAQVEPISAALTAVARHVPPFTLEVGGLGAFPSPRRPRVLWVGIEGGEPLTLLHAAVNEALASLGHRPDARPFHPHLTLGRVQRGLRRDEVAEIGERFQAEMARASALGTTPAEEMILFRSILKPSGAEYHPLRRFPLRG
jgi:2'-5' RNA ligase